MFIRQIINLLQKYILESLDSINGLILSPQNEQEAQCSTSKGPLGTHTIKIPKIWTPKKLLKLSYNLNNVDLIWATSWETLLMPYANKKVQISLCILSLISVLVVRCLDRIIPLVSISEMSRLYLASVAAQASLSLTWSKIPKTGFLVTWLL